MFNPSLEQVRLFFIESWEKFNNSSIISPLENLAVKTIIKHPEYHEILKNKESANINYKFKNFNHNPFLHLSMHLAVAEQINIDQPYGIKLVYIKLASRTNEHQAIHEIIECLETVLYESQITKTEINNSKYMELLKIKSSNPI
ncbi:conserved hypothetical protein of the DUF1841 family [Candidatus Kinetoplastibacterium desouzaii TCC079E]|uniref:DUF1841 family protein n=1 Tax=Candidatus Kinetoplastidibacterium desouzai TCC079E TaxID=1208919 RepID=M1LMX0_9PROT|nr:DUF1841 family protein [Candidatus Kinetoplastibacterium desouzaii]AGF47072.1 conserved hypothetical protein of the DUF1841 family [Candidatus Kinetoplastibacterium desouzaii TCC079E]